MEAKKKTSYLVTFHTPINFGAVLQATALFSYLSGVCDLDTQVINFRTKRLEAVYPLIHWPHSISDFKRFFSDCFNIFNELKKRRKFKHFLKEYLALTKRFKGIKALNEFNPECDYLFTGSDQVFRPNRSKEERSVFYLSFKNRAKRKISYAGSFGGVAVPDSDKAEILSYLSSFYRISVRERSGVETVKQLGLSSSLVLDPVFLLNIEEWNTYENKKANIKKKFILYYALIDNDVYHHYVYCISKTLDLPVVVVGPVKKMPFKVYKMYKSCGPSEFLSLLNKSSYVLTSSFHGVAFSLIYKKQFFSLEEDLILKDRVSDLLKSIDVPYLCFKDFLKMCKDGKENYIDFKSIEPKLFKMINESKTFIKECIDD